jgi:hypothetical protein
MKPNEERRPTPPQGEARVPEEEPADTGATSSEPVEPAAADVADLQPEEKPYTGPERRAQGMLIAEILPPPNPRHPG